MHIYTTWYTSSTQLFNCKMKGSYVCVCVYTLHYSGIMMQVTKNISLHGSFIMFMIYHIHVHVYVYIHVYDTYTHTHTIIRYKQKICDTSGLFLFAY